MLGILAVTRSFGDHGMKEYVTAEPYISVHLLDGLTSPYTEVPFLILACDGLWDVMTDQEAVDLVLERLHSPAGNTAPTEGAEGEALSPAVTMNQMAEYLV